MRRLIRRLAELPAVCGILLIRTYRLLLSPWLGYHCRFQPTCSAYGIEAISRHGLVKGGWLTLRRLARCHPWGGSGFEPVPPVEPTRSHAQCRDHAHQHR